MVIVHITHCGHVPVERSHCTHNLTHCDHKEINRVSELGGHCAKQMLLYQTVTFAVEPENGASFDQRRRSVLYDYR